MSWPGFPKRLQSALKSLSCLAESDEALQSHVIAERIAVIRLAEQALIGDPDPEFRFHSGLPIQAHNIHPRTGATCQNFA